MRINPVNLNQALSRTQSAGVGAVPRVIAKPASVQSSEVNSTELELELAPTSAKGLTKTNKKSRKRGRKNNLDQLGSTVDIWA